MLFACKCLNVSLLAPPASSASASDPSSAGGRTIVESLALQQRQSPQALAAAANGKLTGEELRFLQKAVGPLDSVRVTVHQPDLVRTSQLGATGEKPSSLSSSLYSSSATQWRLVQCIGCDVWTHATNRSGQLVLINPETMTNDEDLKFLETTANYSATFGLLLNQSSRDATEFSNSTDMAAARQLRTETGRSDELQQRQQARHKQLTQHFREAVQREIEATDERIRVYTDQQFRQLQAYRERTQTDYLALVKLALSVPADSAPATAASVTISSISTADAAAAAAAAAAASAASQAAVAKPLLDTPPATPDSTPMSIGNSPNFSRPPPSITSTSLLASSLSAQRAIPFKSKTSPLRNSPLQHQLRLHNNGLTLSASYSAASQPPPPPPQQHSYSSGGAVIEQAIDAFSFEMDGAAPAPPAPGAYHPMVTHSNSYMSDVEESDSDEDSTDRPSEGRAIPRSQLRPKSLSIAQSMPIAMPMAGNLQMHRAAADEDDYDEYAGNLDDGVDIAASIKALARSVHGDAVFGDLPRPRFSTQI